MKTCVKCKQIFSLDMFNQRRGECKQCQKEVDKQWRLNNLERKKQHDIKRRLNNPDYYKQYNKQWHTNNPEYNKEYVKSVTLSYTIVYLLPDHNYVGITNCPTYRMSRHRSEFKRNTSNWTELARYTDREEALAHEHKLHTQGYEGANACYNITQET